MAVPVDYAHLLMVIMWLTYYGTRLIQHSRNDVFLKMPWFLLWFNGYIFGWCYILNNYWNQLNLELTLFQPITFPVTVVGKLGIYSLVYLLFFFTLRFYSPFHNSWYQEVILLVSLLVSCAAIFVLWKQGYNFDITFVVGDVLLSSNATLALFLLIPITRRLNKQSIPALEYIHYIWFVGCIFFASISLMFMTLNAVYTLQLPHTINTDWLSVAYTASTLSLICMMIVNSPDEFIDRTAFFLRWLYIRRLNRLYYYILNHILVVERYPVTPYRWGQPTELAIYERVSSILDMYPFLGVDHPLFQEIQRIEQQCDFVPDCVEALIQIEVPEVNLS